MAYDLAKVTANGNNLIAQILANKSSLSIDKIEISDTQLSSTTDISTMTSVPKVVQTVSANGFSKNSNTLIISTVVDNSSISADYKAWVFGIWGSDSQNGQSQLIAVITSTNSPDTIPAFSGSTPVSYTYKFNIGFSNASQIQFNMIDDSFATNDTVVHTTGDETIDGQKKFKTDPTDSAGNAYAKTIDVNQQLDKKVNVADMRKPASDVAGIEEVNAKQDKIGYTPADNSKVVHDNHDGTEQLNGNPVQPFNKLSDNLGVRNYILQGNEVTSSNPGTNQISFINNGRNGAWNLSPDFFKLTKGTPIVVQFDLEVANSDNKNFWANWSNPWGSFIDLQGTPNLTNGKHHVVIETMVPQQSSDNSFNPTYDTISATYTISNISLYVGSKGTVPSVWLPAPEDKADDSKVAHLSGPNNFDTVPTVNNNPLLLASSLPSDLARTGQAQTFTQPQTFSIAPVINDASTSKGDNQAATMADLKSVENSAWHQLDSKYISIDDYSGSYKGIFLYQINSDQKSINFVYSYIDLSYPPVLQGQHTLTIDLSLITAKISHVNDFISDNDGQIGTSFTTISGSKIEVSLGNGSSSAQNAEWNFISQFNNSDNSFGIINF